jgi:hypothetical protein
VGLFDRFKKESRPGAPGAKLMSDETAAMLKEKQDLANALMAQYPGALPDMNADPQEMQARMRKEMAEAKLIEGLQRNGVESPAVIRTISPTDETDVAGGRAVEFVVSIQGAGGDLHDARVRQHMTPAQLQGLSVGASITVKYDPDAPGTALIVGW